MLFRHTIRYWLPAVSGMACMGFGAGLISIYGFFVVHLSREFGVGVATLNLGPVALLLVPGIVSPLIGKLVDTIAIRRIMLAGATLAMCALLATSQAPTLPVAGLGFLVFALGLALYGPVVVNGLLVKTYPGQEARALSVAAIGVSVATVTLPPLTGYLLASFNWRETLAILSTGIFALLWAAILTGTPAGLVKVPPQRAETIARPESMFRNRNFWLIGFCVALGFNVSVLLAICYPVHLTSIGFSVAQTGWLFSMSGLSGMLGKGLVAIIADSMQRQARWLAVVVMLLQMLGLFILVNASTVQGALPAMCLLGAGAGALLPIHPYLNSRYFVASVTGQVNGAQAPLFLPFALIGLPLAGYVYDQGGSYVPVMHVAIAVLGLAAVLALLLPASEEVTGARTV